MWLESWNRGTVEKTFGYFWDEHGTTKWGPRSIAKLVQITPITMVYGTQVTIVNGVYKPSYNWGAPPCRMLCGIL